MAVLEGLLQLPCTFPLLVALLLLLFVCLHSSGVSNPEKGKEPPGPKPLPILGNLLLLDLKKPYDSLCELSKKYGSVFTIYFGPKKVVVLTGYTTVKQALVNNAEEFGDRDITPLFHDLNKGLGILFSNGENWKEMRRFALTNMRNFGMGKRRSEDKIIEETRSLIEVFEKFEGTPFDTTQPVNYAVSNIICAIVYGSRFEYDDPKFMSMVNRANENIRLAGSASVQLYTMFPWLKPWLKDVARVMKNVGENLKEMRGCIKNLQETLNPQDSRGFVDSFLIYQQNAEKSGQKDSVFHEENLLFCVANLFAAGTDTTGTTLRDESEWEQPYMFHPEHFLDDQGQFVKRDAFLAFSAGRRVCLGESLARMELFLFFATLLQRFHFTPPPGVSEDELDLTPILGITLNPSPHKLCAVSRF